MCGEDKHFRYLHVCRSLGSIESDIGYIIAGKRFDTAIYVVGTLAVAMETSDGEVSLHQSRFQIRHSKGCIRKVDT